MAGELEAQLAALRQAVDALVRMAAIVESSEDAIIGATLDGIITSWNPAAERMYGYAAAEVIGQPITCLIPPDCPDELPRILTPLTSGEHIEHFETERVRKDGTRIAVSISISPIFEVSSRITGAATVARDITERKRAEAERELLLAQERAARAEAEAANRVKDEFLSTAAHELKTPITAMKAYVQLLERALAAGRAERTTEALTVLNRQYDRLRRLVDDLLEVSRLAIGHLQLQRQHVTLATHVTAVVERMQAVTTTHRLVLGALAPVVVEVDPDRIEQVLLNLLSNAIKFSPAGGEIAIRLVVEDGMVVVTVQDQGIGIPQDRQARVFERFYRAHAGTADDYGGMGIGLHLSRELVVRHGGTMWFASTEGQGSTFAFCLPVVPGKGSDDGPHR